MSISSLSSYYNTATTYQTQSPETIFKQQMQDMSRAIQSGDMQGVQDILKKLEQAKNPAKEEDTKNSVSENLKFLSNAIKAGDMASAQSILGEIQSALQKSKESKKEETQASTTMKAIYA